MEVVDIVVGMKEKEIILEIKEVSKNYGRTAAVRAVEMKIGAGDIYALIGPNGSGKTTLMKMIVGLLRIDKGEISILGNQIKGEAIEAKKLIGYVPDKPEGYGYLSGKELLYLTGRLKGMREAEVRVRVEQLMKLFDIEKILEGRMDGYSRGNLQKTAFLAALLGEPKLLIIDEPIVGLDPVSIRVFGERLVKFAKDGGAVLFATHTLDFASKYANRVGVMSEGKIVAEEKLSNKIKIEKVYEKAL